MIDYNRLTEAQKAKLGLVFFEIFVEQQKNSIGKEGNELVACGKSLVQKVVSEVDFEPTVVESPGEMIATEVGFRSLDEFRTWIKATHKRSGKSGTHHLDKRRAELRAHILGNGLSEKMYLFITKHSGVVGESIYQEFASKNPFIEK